jgi:hypothetical protein
MIPKVFFYNISEGYMCTEPVLDKPVVLILKLQDFLDFGAVTEMRVRWDAAK